MKISELRERLKEIEDEHGDLKVSSTGDCNPVEIVSLHEEPVKHVGIISEL
jgi:hypothetical protein